MHRRLAVLRLLESGERAMSVKELQDALPGKCASSTLYRTLRQLQDDGYVNREHNAWAVVGTRVVVELSPRVVHLTRDQMLHPTQQLQELPDGGAYLSFLAPKLPDVAAWIAGFGGSVQAVEPLELIAEVVRLHRAGIETHRDGLVSRDELRARGLPSILPPE